MLDSYGALRVSPAHRVRVLANNLRVCTPSKDAEAGALAILDSVSFDLPPGNMMAIMGGSGLGKTTLLNVLAQRTTVLSSLDFSGTFTLSTPHSARLDRISAAYMVQEDFFLPGLTVVETLRYHAELRLTRASRIERLELVDVLLSLLELDHRKNDLVKLFTGKVSLLGGEQRKLSLAMQLLSKPQVLFLDEPTTGLDASSALTLLSTLKKLASSVIGITVVLSIHQPREETLALFDRLCLLTRGGRLVYFGSLASSVDYFSQLGLEPLISRTDSPYVTINKIVAMLVKDTTSVVKELELSRAIEDLVKRWAISHPLETLLSEKEQRSLLKSNLNLFKQANPLPVYREVYVLTKRTLVVSVRDTMSLLSLIGGGSCVAVIVGWLFYKPVPDLSGIRSITSCLYTMTEVVGFFPLTMEISRLWESDGAVFFREYKEGCTSIPGFILSRRLAKFVTEDVPMVFLFSVITYFMWGLRLGDTYSDNGSAGYWAIYFLICLLVELCSMSLAMLSFALGSSFSTSLIYVNLIYQVQNCGCGYFVNAATMPVYVRWVKYTAFFWYAFGALTANQYTNWMGKCPHPAGSSACTEYSGNYQLKILGFPQHWTWAPIGYLALWALGINVFIGLVLRFRNYNTSMAKKKRNKIGGEDNEEENFYSVLTLSSSSETFEAAETNLSLSLKNISLSVKQRESPSWFSGRTNRQLLNSIDADFRASKINVIMGPSGAGKSTCLNFLANRLLGTFNLEGKLYLNADRESLPLELQDISGYVAQTDNLLLPHLTIREVLYYQAKLRLPPSEHELIPNHIIRLLRLTGLVDCADTLIGSAATKGVSGGEKRRVSIAIQLLSRPKILFLDEPTSGLDAPMAESVLSLLQSLTKKGTTIIMTIHQPNREMFDRFDSLVLLARGGNVVYNGPAASLAVYLAHIGYACPLTVNVADHMLDLMGRQIGESKEHVARRIDDLVANWPSQGSVYEDLGTTSRELNLNLFKREQVPWFSAFKTVCRRQFIVSIRAFDVLLARLWTVVSLAIVYSLFFTPLRNTPDGISNRLGLTRNITDMYFCGLINNLGLYPSQRDLFHQEYRDKTYGSVVFGAAYLCVELPFEIISSAFFSAMIVFVIGLPRTAEMYFSLFFCAFASISCGEASGIFFNSVFQHMGLVTNILNLVFTIAIIMGGTMSLQMPLFFRGWNWINPAKYVVEICTDYAFRGQTFECDGISCSLSTGEAVLRLYGMDAYLPALFAALTACLVLYRAVAFGAIYVRAKWFL